ncbi:hypothetical protein FE257_008673 [Aspergillus nanangensis]|uniref:Carboxylesterase type B domain-containing protein n=1 Tax=Aspergillus nanangensis TaxID=2582783 RepID=A0AAD4CKV0_ASPNN|nr:hypothetical protein FE257_008673 [Aspergillus nanangensis]
MKSLLFVLGPICVAAGSAHHALPTATIDSGLVVGTTTLLPSSTATVNKYLGVPFGAPPVRFRPPEPVAPWSTIRNATTWGPACIQQMDEDAKSFFDMVKQPPPPGGEREDCLNLNIFTPASASTGSKAVLVWIYGGSYVVGTAGVPLYDGSSFAANQDVVVVTINYRTNVFGFVGDESIPVGERNLGFLDQRLALDWVRRNIASLGGDPSKVTIMGESAGGSSVDALVLSPPDPLPFRAAIMQSGQSSVKAPIDDPERVAQAWQKLGEFAGCNPDGVLDCLRSFPAMKLKELAQNASLPFSPLPDGGVTLTATPRLDRLNSTDEVSSIARVPILVGSNADEAKPYIIGQNSTKEYLMGLGLGNLTDLILKQYPLGSPGAHTENDRLSLILTDFGVQCPTKVLATESAEVGIHTWRYVFNASFPNNETFKGSGAYHMAEIPLVFGTYLEENSTEFQRDVSGAMQKAWADFAKDPTRGPGWDEVPTVGIFGDGVKAGMNDEGKQALTTVDSGDIAKGCDLFQPIYDGVSTVSG